MSSQGPKPSVAKPAVVAKPVASAAGPVKSWASLAKAPLAAAAAAATSAAAANHATATPNNANAAITSNTPIAPTTAAASAPVASSQPSVSAPAAPAVAAASPDTAAVAASSSSSTGDAISSSAPVPVTGATGPGSFPPRVVKKKNKHNKNGAFPPSTGGSAVSSPLQQAMPTPATASDITEQTNGQAAHNTGAPGSTPSSHTNSPARQARKTKKLHGGQAGGAGHHFPGQGGHPHPHAHHPQHAPQQMAFAGQPFYPGQVAMFPPGMRAPFPTPLGPNGLPLPEFLGGMPMPFPPQFPMYAPGPMPPAGYPQQQQGGKRANFPHPQQQQQPNYPFYPAAVAPGSASGSASPATATSPTNAGSGPAPPAATQQFRGAPYPPAFFQPTLPPQFAGQPPYGSFPLAYQMANLSMGGPFLQPQMGVGGAMPPQFAVADLPPFPTPFAQPPFDALLASMPPPMGPGAAPYFSVDVECVATGPGHNDRALAHVAVVDQHARVVLNVYIKPTVPVVSYLPALTGLSAKEVDSGMSESDAVALFRNIIPSNAVLVGQNILKDVEWLHLEEGTDFASMLDLAGLFATRHPVFHTMSFFSLAHEAKSLLSIDQAEQHHPAIDAWLSIRLYQLYQVLQTQPEELERARRLLLETPVDSAFSKKNPVYEGVCMGNKKACQCGSPWFF